MGKAILRIAYNESMEPVKNSNHASQIIQRFKSLSPQGSIFRIALIYLIYGILWILATDLILERMGVCRFNRSLYLLSRS